MPGLKVVAPYTGADAKGLLKSAIRDPNPVIFLEHEMLYGQSFDVPEDPEFIVPIGKAQDRARPARTSRSPPSRAWWSWRCRPPSELEKQGIAAEVIDLRSLRPFDVETIVEIGQEDQPDRHRSRKAGRSPASAPRSRR